MAYSGGAAGVTAAAMAHTSSYRVKFRKREFLDLIQIAQPDIVYHVRRMHFFAYDGFVMYTLECESEDLTQGVTDAIEFSKTQWAE